jgi:alpha-tubulin suppressor-like RCC1 family protein
MNRIVLSIVFFVYSLLNHAQCFVELSFGSSHTTAKNVDGTLWGWGYGAAGQLLTLNSTEPNPIPIGTDNDWIFFKNGVINTFAIKSDGTLWGCGSNEHGSLGVNSSAPNFTTFQQITTATNWVKVSPSYFYTIALKADGTLWGWGRNDYYQTGSPPATLNRPIPVQIGTDTDWVEIAAGTSSTSFAIKSNGTIWGWGSNTSSIIVSGSGTVTVSSPTQVGTATDWVKMSVGPQHILAQKQDGTLWSWGGGEALGLGGTPSITNIPQQISTDVWKSFSAGSNTSFGIKSDGTLWAWGRNHNGQLADGTTENRLVPTQIGTATDWDTVQARNFVTTMATKTDGTVWYWGRNYYGEFGNGTSYDLNYYNTPQQTPGICVTPLTAGEFESTATFSMYPNPARDVVWFDYELEESGVVFVYDLMGRVMHQRSLVANQGSASLDVSTYASGVYWVVVQQGTGNVSRSKLVVE